MVGRDPPAGTPVSYSRQYRRCGRPGCAVCGAGGPGHGPYWYAYWREGGRKCSRYLGREAPPEMRAAAASDEVPAGQHSLPEVRIQTLGAFAVWLKGQALPEARWNRPTVAALFKCLLSAPGHRLGRDQLLELLWPEAAPDQGMARLRATVHRLRHALGDAGAHLLRYHHEVLALDAGESAWLDADRFEAAARGALAGRDATVCRVALALYTGDYLPDDVYAEWAVGRREELRGLHTALLLHLATLCAQLGAVEEAEGSLRAVLAADRCHEEAALALMRLYGSAGRPNQALRTYRRLADALRDELDVQPGAEAQALAGTFTAARGAREPTAPSEPAVSTNLPAQLTSFIGRRQELAALAEVLRPVVGDGEGLPCRLLTLTGPGGCGKTRLALQLADDLLEHYADGVWLVELAALQGGGEQESAGVAGVVARALGLREEAGRQLEDTLEDYLKRKRLLLVLDNCEHLVAACAALAARLLASCRGLRILATSREALGVGGEQPWPVPPLSLPEMGATVGMLPQYEAVRLFLELARVQRPGLRLAEENAAAVMTICRCVDGLPLAIELAAARVGTLSIEGIAARLRQSFALLTGGPRTAQPRQQTLRAALDWSYGLLSELEQAILRRLSAFAAGWVLEAAEAVCAGGEVVTDAVLGGLDGLVRKSLVAVEDDAEPGQQQSVVRYRMLETVRQYGQEKLVALGEEAPTRDRHLAHYLALAEEAEPRSRGSEQVWWLARLEREHDNLRAALGWAGTSGNGATGLRLAAALGWFWSKHSHLREGRHWLEEFLALSADGGVVRAKALRMAGQLAFNQSDFDRARALGEQSLTLYQQAGDTRGAAMTLNDLGNVANWQGDYERALGLFHESLGLLRELGEQRFIAVLLNNLGNVARQQGDYARAAALFQESLALQREGGDIHGMADALHNLAAVAFEQGAYGRSMALAEESLVLRRELGNKQGIALALNCMATAAEGLGDFARAIGLNEESVALYRDLGHRGGAASSLSNLAFALYELGEDERAARIAEESRELYREVGEKAGMVLVLVNLGRTLFRRGDRTQARLLLEEGLALARAISYTLGVALTCQFLGWVACREGNYEEAISLYLDGLEVHGILGRPVGQVACLEGLASVAAEQGRPERAVQLLGATTALREAIGIARRPSECTDHEQTLAMVHGTLREDAFRAAWAAGRAMPLEQAVAYAGETAIADRPPP